MRLALKAVMMTAVIFGAVNYMLHLHTGRSLLPIWAEKIKAVMSNVRQDTSQALGSLTEAGTAADAGEVIYKWTDADGILQYTNVKPPAGVAVEIVEVDPNANLMQAPAPKSESRSIPEAATAEDKAKIPEEPGMPFPYSPEQIKKTMDDASKAQQGMNEKMQKQQEILDNL